MFRKIKIWFLGLAQKPSVRPLASLPSHERARLFGAVFAGGLELVPGQRSTGNVAEGILEVDMREEIMELEPDSSPLLVLSKKAGPEVAINPKFSWWEDRLNARFDTLSAEKTSGETVLPVTTESLWAADDLIYNTRTTELIRVVSRASANLTVVRAVGSTAATIKTTDELIRVGSAAEEGAADKPARSRNPVEVSNYLQIFREPVDATGTFLASKNRTKPRDWDRAMNHAGIEHAKDIEYHAMLGRPSVNTSGTNPRRTTGGFNYFATQNITDVGGEMTETEFWNALNPCFRYGGNKKLLLASTAFISIITGYPRAKMIVTQPDPNMTYGIHVVQLITPMGKILNVVNHPLLEGGELSKQAWIIDLANVAYKYLNGDEGNRDTHIRPEIQAPGVDGKKDEYLTECGFEFNQSLTHGKIVNATS
jgi:hypothetical protein